MELKNGDMIKLDENEMIYGVTDNFTRRLGFNLCMVITKYYLYTASFGCLFSDFDK